MLVNIKVTGGLNIESGQIDPKATQGLKSRYEVMISCCPVNNHQYQFSVVGQLSGPRRFGPVAFLDGLFTADLAVCFPLRETLQGFTWRNICIV